MPVLSLPDGRRGWRPITPAAELARFASWLALVAITVFCWRVMTEDTIWAFVESAPQQAADIFGRMLPPRWSYAERLWRPLWDTINIATIGTLLAIILATPIAFLAARNTTPSVVLVRPLALLIIVASRSINALIWGLLLVIILGPGVLAGIIAIALRSIGFIGKLLYEAIEEIDEAQVEAIRATGASPGPNHDLRHRAPDHARLRLDQRVPVGHQYPGVHGAGPGRRRRSRTGARVVAECPGLAAGHSHPDHDLRDGHRQRMGIGESSQGDYLTCGPPWRDQLTRLPD